MRGRASRLVCPSGYIRLRLRNSIARHTSSVNVLNRKMNRYWCQPELGGDYIRQQNSCTFLSQDCTSAFCQQYNRCRYGKLEINLVKGDFCEPVTPLSLATSERIAFFPFCIRLVQPTTFCNFPRDSTSIGSMEELFNVMFS